MDLSSLFTAQNRRLFKLTMALKGSQELLLESFAGSEGLSTDFGFQLDLIYDNENVKLKSAIGQAATIEIERPQGAAMSEFAGNSRSGTAGADRRGHRRATGALGQRFVKTQLHQIQLGDVQVDDPNEVIFRDQLFQRDRE